MKKATEEFIKVATEFINNIADAVDKKKEHEFISRYEIIKDFEILLDEYIRRVNEK